MRGGGNQIYAIFSGIKMPEFIIGIREKGAKEHQGQKLGGGRGDKGGLLHALGFCTGSPFKSAAQILFRCRQLGLQICGISWAAFNPALLIIMKIFPVKK